MFNWKVIGPPLRDIAVANDWSILISQLLHFVYALSQAVKLLDQALDIDTWVDIMIAKYFFFSRTWHSNLNHLNGKPYSR
jgi:hypothetical protein